MKHGTVKYNGGCGCEGANVFYIVGDGVTTAFPITHGLNSKEIVIATRQASSPFAAVTVPAEYTSNSVITFTFAAAPAVGECYVIMLYRVCYSYAVTGDGVTTAFTITHNLGTQNIIVGTRQAFSPYARVSIPTTYATVNTIVLTFAVAPGSGEVFRVNLIPLC